MPIELPRYVVARERGGRTVYYWQVTKKHRAIVNGEPWPVGVTRLPDDAGEMLTAAARLNAELDQLRSGVAQDARKGSMPWLIAQYERSTYFLKLRKRTQRSYTYLARHVLQWSKEKGHPPITDLRMNKVLEFLTKFDGQACDAHKTLEPDCLNCRRERPVLRHQVAGYLRTVLHYAERTGVRLEGSNPARGLRLGGTKRQKPIRIVDVPQVLAIVAKAREMGLPHIAVGTLLHFDLGQRQGDVLRLQKPRDYRGGVFQFEQSKTGQVVTIMPFLSETREALNAIPDAQFMLVVDANGRSFTTETRQRTYGADFRRVADACGFKDLWEMELRHSCVIFCERAGLRPSEIATRTGHTLATASTILEKYRYRDSVVAQHGTVMLEEYRNRLRTKV